MMRRKGFTERFRSHHDAKRELRKLVGADRYASRAEPADLELTLDRVPRTEQRAVYLHVPYCDKLCSFCTMNRCRVDESLRSYAEELDETIAARSSRAYINATPFRAVYMGGGTPTVFAPAELEVVLSSVRSHLPLADDVEWTIETTLHNLTDEKLALLVEYGVNRISIGVQTFSDRGRRLLGRSGSGEWAATRIGELREAFPGSLCIDLIYSYPDQSEDEVAADATAAIACGVDSVSLYSLMVHDGSALAARIGDGELRFERTTEWDRVRHNLLVTALRDGGFDLLELTKMARPGRDEYRYIRVRYLNGDVLPIGQGAGGRLGDLELHYSRAGLMIGRADSRHDRYHLFLGDLQFGRYDAGVARARLGDEAALRVEHALPEYEAAGYLRRGASGALELTPDGVFWGNTLAVDLLGRIIEGNGAARPAPSEERTV